MKTFREGLTEYKTSKRKEAPNKPVQKKRKKKVDKPWKVMYRYIGKAQFPWDVTGSVFGRYKSEEIAKDVKEKKERKMGTSFTYWIERD